MLLESNLTLNTLSNVCACILPGCSCRKGQHSGGVADAQPPATSFYPSRIQIPRGRRSNAHLWIGNGEPIHAVHLTWGIYHVSMTQHHRCNSMLIAFKRHTSIFAFYSVGIVACSRWLSVKRHHRSRISSPTAPQRGASKQELTAFNTIANICAVKTGACILPGCSCREGHDSGGVADAQPPATSFYPYQDTPPLSEAATTHIRRLAMGRAI